MSWEWSPLAKEIANEAARRELVGAELRLLASDGTALAAIPLTGTSEVVTGEAASRGKAVRAVIQRKNGTLLASAPASSVCDLVDVERAAKITVTVSL